MTDYVIGLDLGQMQDYTAAVAVRRLWFKPGQVQDPTEAKLWHVATTILRWPLMTPYTQIVQEVIELYRLIEHKHAKFGVKLVVDAGGPGRPVIDLFRQQRLIPIALTITGGDVAHARPDGSVTVPRRDVLSTVVVAYHVREFQFNPQLEHAAEMDMQLANFKYKPEVTSRQPGYDLQDSKVHDDLVMAAGTALWYSTMRLPKSYPGKWGQGGEVQPMHNPMAKS